MNNTRLIIHVGYPKTGSSTLQFGLLKHLDEIGHLKLNTWRLNNPKESLDRRLSSMLFKGETISKKYKNLVLDQVNVISDESLTAPMRLRRINYGENIKDPLSFPDTIKAQFKREIMKGLNVKILVVLRNQADLLFSQYVEEYKLVLNKSIDIIHDKYGEIDLNGMEIYDYSRYLEVLNKTFGRDKIEVLLYEDLKYDKNYFFKKISKLLSIDINIVSDIFSRYHVNKKNKNDKGYLTEVSKIQVDYFSSQKKIEIMERYYKSNSLLMDDWNLSREKLSDYKYLNL
jgi:hypothetical protein